MTFTTGDLQSFLQLLEEEPQVRARLRMLLVTDALQALPDRFERLTEIVERLAQAQQRTEERLERLESTVQALAEAQRRTEERLEQLAQAQQRTEERLERLEDTVQTLGEEVRDLVRWQRGEAGRREGERYERRILRRALFLFDGGQGGTPDEPSIQERLSTLIRSLPDRSLLSDEEAPFLADLIWWKGDQFVVVEISMQVNGHDILRAALRAGTLQRAGVQAMGMVIGEEWMELETRKRAKARSVEWKVGSELSEGLLAFRRLSA